MKNIHALSEIKNMDPALFTVANSAKRSGHYVDMRLTKNTLIINSYVSGIQVLGKTNHPRILEACDYEADMAIMLDMPGWGEVWFHLMDLSD